MKYVHWFLAVICAATVCGASRIDDVIALKEAIDRAKAAGERFEVKPTGDAAFDREIRKFADGKLVVWTGDPTPPEKLARKDVSTTPESRIGWFEHWFKDDPDWWLKRLKAKRDEIRKGPGTYDLVMLGDSITHRWETVGTNEYAHLKRDFSVLNLGYAGDRTQHLLWRLRNGENDGWKAKCILILIGTNNYEDAPSYMSWGVRDILKLVREKHPEAKILLSAIFPRNRTKKDSYRYKNDCANELFRSFADGRDVIWFDMEKAFLEPDGSLPASLFPDALHPNERGYEIWRTGIIRKYQEVFGADAPTGFRQAKWIGFPGICCASSRGVEQPVPVFRQVFDVPTATDAELVISGLGYFTCEIDGTRVSDARLVPAPTQYDRRWRYRRFPLKGLAAGRHEIRVSVGGGLYNPQTRETFGFRDAPWRDYPKMICELHDPAGKVLLASDDGWAVSAGPIVYSTLRGGETYDARLELAAPTNGIVRVPTDEYCQPMKRKVPRWEYAKVVAPPGGIAEEEAFPPCRVTGVLPLVRKPGTDLWVAPSNMTGVVRMRVKGPRGASAVLRHGERLNAAGDGLDNRMIEMFVKDGTFQRDEYILKGTGGVEEWTPEFTFHGFQYVTACVSNGAEIVSLEAQEIHTDFRPVGAFRTSDPKLAALHLCGLRSCLGNWVGWPMDCPHREKNGWTSEARLMCAALLRNCDCADAYRGWLRSVADAQRPSGQVPGIVPTNGWGYNWGAGPVYDSALVMIPWDVWTIRKDRSLLDEFYPNMKRLMDYYASIVTFRGLIAHGLNDWLPPPNAVPMPRDYVQTAFVIRMLEITSQTARLLGRADEADDLAARRVRMLAAFRAAFFGERENQRTTFYALALAFNLLSGPERPVWAKLLAERVRANGHKVDYGTVGSGCVLRELCRAGYKDDAYRLMTQPENPGYWHWIESKGLTLFPETFEADVDGSRNHGAFADIVAVLDEYFNEESK